MEHLFQSYNELLKTNPFVASFLPIYVAGALTLAFRTVPMRLWGIIRNQSTTTLNLLSTGAGSTDMQYHSFLLWFVNHGFMKWSRSLAVESAWTTGADGNVLPGNGTHYFMWKGRPCWLSKARLEQNGTTNQITHTITVGMFGRNQELLKQMVDEFRWRPNSNRGHLFYPDKDGVWCSSLFVSPRPLHTIILNAGVKEEIIEKLQWFFDNRDWYVKRGLAYRLVILLEGPPGTGKTSFLRALCTHFKRNLCPINLASTHEDLLPRLIRNAPHESFIVMEDFDASPAVLKAELGNDPTHQVPLNRTAEAVMRAGKSAILQALDGVDVLDGQVIFLSTNHIERIEPSVIRDERVNHIIHLGLLNNEAVHRYIDNVFEGEHQYGSMTFADIAGATLQKLYVKHHRSYQDFIAAIPVANPDIVSESHEETV